MRGPTANFITVSSRAENWQSITAHRGDWARTNAPCATPTVAFDWSLGPGQFMFSISVINCTYGLIALRFVPSRCFARAKRRLPESRLNFRFSWLVFNGNTHTQTSVVLPRCLITYDVSCDASLRRVWSLVLKKCTEIENANIRNQAYLHGTQSHHNSVIILSLSLERSIVLNKRKSWSANLTFSLHSGIAKRWKVVYNC